MASERDDRATPVIEGVLVVDKPKGMTSHDVVAVVRRILKERRVGHTGTLDPLATGVLPLVIGRATRLARFLSAERKRYEATIALGVETDTFDAEGSAAGGARFENPAAPLPDEAAVRAALQRFVGTFSQVPPAYSAKKVGGVAAHRLARRGAAVDDLPAVEVTVHDLLVTDYREPTVQVTLEVSSGFYVRSLAHDLGRALGCGAHLAALRRTACGEFDLSSAVPLDGLDVDVAAARHVAAGPDAAGHAGGVADGGRSAPRRPRERDRVRTTRHRTAGRRKRRRGPSG